MSSSTQHNGSHRRAQIQQVPIPHLDVPYEHDGSPYVFSFTPDAEATAIREFFDKYGFVVVRDVLAPVDADATVADMWSILEESSTMKSNDSDTWHAWPPESLPQYGTVTRKPVFRPQFMRNRQNPNVHRIFTVLLGGETNLLVNVDRGCLYRPTKNVKFGDGTVKDMPEWRTKDNVHLDMNPWLYLEDAEGPKQEIDALRYTKINHFIFENNQVVRSDGLTLQGVLNLLDNHDEDGGFWVVPGFHKVFADYFATVRGSRKFASHSFPPLDYVAQRARRIPMRQGSMVVWDQRMPHGSKGNDGSRFRAAQFIRMFPAATVSQARGKARAEAILAKLWRMKTQITVTDLGKVVFGFHHVAQIERPSYWGKPGAPKVVDSDEDAEEQQPQQTASSAVDSTAAAPAATPSSPSTTQGPKRPSRVQGRW